MAQPLVFLPFNRHIISIKCLQCFIITIAKKVMFMIVSVCLSIHYKLYAKSFQMIFAKRFKIMRRTLSIMGLILLKMADWQLFWISVYEYGALSAQRRRIVNVNENN